MNPDNYASLEASKRLEDAGIVMETEKYWVETYSPFVINKYGLGPLVWQLTDDPDSYIRESDVIPAPSMAEIWRELPDSVQLFKDPIIKQTVARLFNSSTFAGTNTTDALIELLIWVRREAKS